MNLLNNFLFVALPYIAIAVFCVGVVQFTWPGLTGVPQPRP